jgi:hypothetical protein
MAAFLDAVLFTPTLGGTTDWIVSAAVQGYQSPTAAGAVNARVYKYRAESNDLSQWEEGEGPWASGTATLPRTTVFYNSAGTGTLQSGAGSKINFSTVPVVAMGVQSKLDTISPEEANTFTALQQAQLLANLNIKFGQCVLAKSGANIVLTPKGGGNLITINGLPCSVPAAGVSLAATGLSVGTEYNIYAVATAGVVTSLEASTTAHSMSSTTGNVGVEIKTGDDTRSMVGRVRIITGPAFADTITQRFVRSWFNRIAIRLRGIFTASRSVNATTFTEINTEIRVEFLIWADEIVQMALNAPVMVVSGTSTYGMATIGFDGVSDFNDQAGTWYGSTSGVIQPMMTYAGVKDGLSEGYHYATVIGKTNVGGNLIGLGDSTGGFANIQLRIGN